MNSFEIWQVIIGCLNIAVVVATFCSALYVGVKANEINDRMRQLQDYVAIAVVPDGSVIKLLNVGKVNLYLWGFDMPGNTHYFDRPRLIPASSLDSAYYFIGTPDLDKIIDNKFDFKLYLTDQFSNKWITNAGGDVTEVMANKDGKDIKTKYIKVWTYDTSKTNWSL